MPYVIDDTNELEEAWSKKVHYFTNRRRPKMIEYSAQNKKAWEHHVYEFWVEQSGTPVDRAQKDLEKYAALAERRLFP